MPRERACPGLGDPPVVTAAAVLPGRRLACRLAGARRGSAACGRSRWWRSSSRACWRSSGRWRRIPGTAWRSARPGSAPTAARLSPARVMCPCRTVRSEPRTVGVSPAQLASLRALGNRLMSPISASMTRAVNWPTPGGVVRVLTRGPALACWRSSPSIRSISTARPAGDRQGVGHDLPGDRGQVELGQPAAAGPGQVAAGPVVAEVGDHRVDPVLLPGAQPDQPGPVPQQGTELPHRRRRDPRLREQVRAQQLRQGRGAGPCRSSAARRGSPCTAAGAPGAPHSRNLPAAEPASSSRTRPRTPPASRTADRRSAARWARSRSPCSCSAAPSRPRWAPPPGSACDARRYRRKQTLPGLLSRAWNLSPGASCYRAELGRGPALIGSKERACSGSEE
jgi:hypothetical protein